MRKKLNFTACDKYQASWANQLCAEMLSAWLDGKNSPKSVGCEQGCIPTWDDVVVEEADGSWSHHQIKRQNNGFDSSHSCRRGKKKNDDPEELSELDKVFAALAENSNGTSQGSGTVAGNPQMPLRRFFLVLPRNIDIPVKANLTLPQVNELTRRCHKIGQRSEEFIAEAGSPGLTQNLQNWLFTWCGFLDWEHIIRALNSLTILFVGTEVDIHEAIEKTLAIHFDDALGARRAIDQFLNDNADTTQATTPWQLLKAMPELSQRYRRWAQYNFFPTESKWRLAGTVGSMEKRALPSKEVIASFWNPNTATGDLRILAPTEMMPLRDSLLRLALHATHYRNDVQFQKVDAWKEKIKAMTGGTFGLSINDNLGMNWQELKVPYEPADSFSLDTSAAATESIELDKEMAAHTWQAVQKTVSDQLRNWGSETPGSDVLQEIEGVWNRWLTTLDVSPAEQRKLLTSMMTTKAEGPRCSRPELRAGPITVELMAEGLLCILAVVAALDPLAGTWEKISGKTVHVIALQRCANLGQGESPRKLSEQSLDILATEDVAILVLAGVESGPTELLDSSLAEDMETRSSLGSPKQPMMLLTNSTIVQQRKLGVIRWRQGIRDTQKKSEDAFQKLINEMIEGVI